MAPKRIKPEDIWNALEEHDSDARLEAEQKILSKAQSLTNGHKGDEQVIGEVTYWQTKELIELGRMVRMMAQAMPYIQMKSDCALNHEGKRWAVKIFGASFALPISVAICWIGFIVWWCIKYDVFSKVAGQ